MSGIPLEKLPPSEGGDGQIIELPDSGMSDPVVEAVLGEPLIDPDVTAVARRRLSSRADNPAPLDDEVVEATKRGERWAWEAAYDAYARALTGFLVLRLRDREDVAEAVSETFLRALDRSASFRGDANSFRAWMFRIARNVANDRLRAKQRQPQADHDVDPEDRLGKTVDEALIADEDARAVRDAVATLDPDDREVLWLRIVGRLSSAEVGEIVGKKAGAVRMQQQRALLVLARRLGIEPGGTAP